MRTTDASKTTLCSWVDRELRQQLERLAIEGDRSLSAEIWGTREYGWARLVGARGS